MNNCAGSFEKKFLDLDKFGQAFVFNIEQGRSSLRSKIGASCSIIFITILIVFTGYKINIMKQKQQIDVLSVIQENIIDESDVFDAQKGFNVAAAVFNSFNPR